MKKVTTKKKSLVKKLIGSEKKKIQRKTHAALLKLGGKLLLVLCLVGFGFFLGVHRRVILANGARPVIPKIPGIDLPQVMTSKALLAASEWNYDRLVVIGGGVIGVELATIYGTLGSEVTMLEMSSRLLDNMDETISSEAEYVDLSALVSKTNAL